VRDLDSDDAVYILEDLDADDQEEVLAKLPGSERVLHARAQPRLPGRIAGRRMQADFIAVPPFWTVGQTIDFMRDTERSAGASSTRSSWSIPAGASWAARWRWTSCCRTKRPVRVEAELMGEVEERTVRMSLEDQEDVAETFKKLQPRLGAGGRTPRGGWWAC
jgi:magnesium transporter